MAAGAWPAVQLFFALGATVFLARFYFALTAGMGALISVVLIRCIVCCCHGVLLAKISNG